MGRLALPAHPLRPVCRRAVAHSIRHLFYCTRSGVAPLVVMVATANRFALAGYHCTQCLELDNSTPLRRPLGRKCRNSLARRLRPTGSDSSSDRSGADRTENEKEGTDSMLRFRELQFVRALDSLRPDIRVLWSFEDLSSWQDGVLAEIRRRCD